ncbi:IS5 family transposase [Desulfurispirillum indicum]|uniref:IS5 family transposase n=1 Tax=Desulfurispirillum indicum TaxID=936456 RepID=UPI001CF97154|nr:IS5 family transposase [Desulfurispirillum indicum]UCZ56250.1 IS5 family transposase [Desulfurispirillum indicum]UCZ56987.1 IS5 family transposase [Desulfurispirillum indicum]UCZ57167.1 IS5 family transposase [Desulfurispirillum indicum]UCZ57447.1 IS5 family transposase [Desulfurispirillum indicum]
MSKVQSWEVSDAFWQRVEPLLPIQQRDPDKTYKRKPGGGRKRLDPRMAFSGIVYVLRTGCQWKAIPKEQFGCASAVHKYFIEWSKAGVFEAIWRQGLAEYDEMEGIAWEWQSIDGGMYKAPMALETVGKNPTDRGKNGSKRHVLVDGRGVPLSIVVTGANRHDVSQLEAVLDGVVFEKPAEQEQYLCADCGYKGKQALSSILQRGYIPHVKQRKEEIEDKKRDPSKKARRWIVEASISWFNRFRKIHVRFEKLEVTHYGLTCLAAAIITYRKIGVIYG